MNRYDEYRDSGVEWIGEIPKHWKLIKLNILSESISNGTTAPQVDLTPFPVSRIETISGGFINPEKVGYIDSTYTKVNQYLLNDEDILFSHINSFEIVGQSAIYRTNLHGILYHGMNLLRIVLKRDLCSPTYLHNFLQSSLARYFIRTVSKHAIGQVSISISNLSELRVPTPPPSEQKLIASYLDKKTEQIDLLVEKLREKTNLIKEGILNYCYESEIKKTKLNSHPTCWFQKIPEDWEIVKFRQLFEPVSIKNNSTDERLLSVTQDKGVVFRDEQDRDVVNPGGDTSSYKLVTPGDVIISLRSADGGLEVSDVRGLVSPAYIVLKPKFKYDRNFYRYLLTSNNFVVELSRYIKGIRDGKNIYFDDIRDVLIPYLPMVRHNDSYQKVVSHHGNLVESFSKIEKKIAYLNEYRQSLISSVVTGKIRITEDVIWVVSSRPKRSLKTTSKPISIRWGMGLPISMIMTETCV